MNVHRRQATWMCWVTVVSFAAPAAAQLTATQPAASTRPAASPADDGPQVGTVTGDNVNVRSGSDQNYYAVTKLNRGDQVTIVGERFGWLEILPPVGTYSVIDKNYVDRVDDETGVLNGTVRVYAGSELDQRRYARQGNLHKGDRVQVIGETADGKCYRIVPPRGAHLWISGDYVARGARVARAPGPYPPTIETVKPGELKLTGDTPGEREAPLGPLPTPRPLAASPGSAQSGEYQLLLNAIEAEIAAESAKPVGDRVFEPILHKLQPLAEQDQDKLAKLYAEARIKQVQDHLELVAAVQEMRDLRAKRIAGADAMRRAREKIKAKAAVLPDDIIVRGDIRVSGIYDGSGNRPKRWRIVEPGVSPARTLAYIEVPPGSPIDPVQYYGRYVGIRASARRLLPGTMPPVPIYTVEEIKILDRAEQSKRAPDSPATASPLPPEATTSSTQPATPPAEPASSSDKAK